MQKARIGEDRLVFIEKVLKNLTTALDIGFHGRKAGKFIAGRDAFLTDSFANGRRMQIMR